MAQHWERFLNQRDREVLQALGYEFRELDPFAVAAAENERLLLEV